MENNTNISERISQFIDYKQLTINKFSDSVGASNSYFNKVIKNGTSIGSDRLESIVRTYPDLNPIWLLIGRGNMILETDSAPVEVKNIVVEMSVAGEIKNLKDRIELQKDTISHLQERILFLQTKRVEESLESKFI